MNSAEFLKNYAEGVLGLRYMPFQAVAEAAERIPVKLIVLDLPWPNGLASVDLFQKMMGAIGLGANDLEIIEALPGELGPHQERIALLRSHGIPLLAFSPDLLKALDLPEGGALAAATYGPRDLERNAALKRESWNILQKFKTK